MFAAPEDWTDYCRSVYFYISPLFFDRISFRTFSSGNYPMRPLLRHCCRCLAERRIVLRLPVEKHIPHPVYEFIHRTEHFPLEERGRRICSDSSAFCAKALTLTAGVFLCPEGMEKRNVFSAYFVRYQTRSRLVVNLQVVHCISGSPNSDRRRAVSVLVELHAVFSLRP